MDYKNYISESEERKEGKDLQREESSVIQHLKRQSCSNRANGSEIGCAPSTVSNALRRGI